MRVLLIDNNDSFTRNLEHLLAVTLDVVPVVTEYASLACVDPLAWELIVLSPGPGAPADYPGYGPVLSSSTPVLGVCLGVQLINNHFGGSVEALPGCVHGKTEVIELAGRSCEVARYHSLYCARVAPELRILAANRDGVPMALQHRSRPIVGYQFHPESFLTPDGKFIVAHALGCLDLD
jgi:anthranilate/para-aminobenzoate synthase component II